MNGKIKMIQYNYNRINNFNVLDGTVALEVPTKHLLEQLFITHSNQIVVCMGISITSKHDQFEKKIGKQLAQNRLTPLLSTLTSININGTRHKFMFRTNEINLGNKKYTVMFHLTTVAESNKVYFTYSHISEC
jgi:hypothetical protein